jgi:hypothetical protein
LKNLCCGVQRKIRWGISLQEKTKSKKKNLIICVNKITARSDRSACGLTGAKIAG